MNKFKVASICLLVFGLVVSCSNIDDVGKSSQAKEGTEIVQVKYGTSFGECIGYCKRDLTLKSGFVTYNRSGWVLTIETITFTEVLDNGRWNYFKNELDTKSFLVLPSVLGCPDCADGGAEWIEIELTNGVKHKVTFEYFNEPTVVKYYVKGLRDMMNNFENLD